MPRSTDSELDEQAPLLGQDDRNWLYGADSTNDLQSLHQQYCRLVGLVPSTLPPAQRAAYPKPGPNTLYQRTQKKYRTTQFLYTISASLSTTLLLSQVVIGAALTGLGAFEANHIVITVFGAVNTVIAACVTYLKSRGQPMRARMLRDDLERIAAEIENSEIMWLGVARGMHGYDEIDTDEVSVRSEVARLTRLYDRAIRNHLQSNPDFQQGGQGADNTTALRARGQGQVAAPAAAGQSSAPVPVAEADDESPATKATPKEEVKEAPVVELVNNGGSSSVSKAEGEADKAEDSAESSTNTNGKAPKESTADENDIKAGGSAADLNESPVTAPKERSE